MQDVKTIDDFHRSARSVRTIAEGIFDKAERRTVLRFVRDCEKMVAEKRKPS